MTEDRLRLDAYLSRVAYAGPREPSEDVLRRLHEAHLGAVPFENLDILLGRRIRLDLPSLEHKLVDSERGGYCFEQNTLFRAALESLGFGVDSLAARVRIGSTATRPRTHMLLRVRTTPDAPAFIADVGFGGDGFVHPLPLAASSAKQSSASEHRLLREDDEWVLQARSEGGWDDLYAFTEEAHHPVDFEVANHFTSTHESSPFVNGLTAQRAWPGGRAVLRNRELVVRRGDASSRTTVQDPAHLLQLLEDTFGLRFPEGTRFSQPEF